MKLTKIPASRTGLFVIVCFSLLVIALFLIGDKQKLFSNTSPYYIKFREANGIKTDIRSGKGSMGKLLTDEGLYHDIRSIVTNSDRSIVAITNTAHELEATIDSALRNFSSTSSEFRELGHSLNSGKGSLGK